MTGSTVTSTADEMRSWLTNRIAEYLETDPERVDPKASFDEQGLDSMAALTLCDDIEDELGFVVEPTLTWDHPNINELADYLLKVASGAEAAK